MNITKPLREGEAYYELKNISKTYRTRKILFVFKANQKKKRANLEINRELSSLPEKGHTILNQTDQERAEMNKIRSVRRSRTKISDIIEMNDFAWFGTLTTSPKKINRYDDNLVKKRVTKALSNMQRLYRFEYLLIPERHKDGALHFHALLTNLPSRWLNNSGITDMQGRPQYNLVLYKLGFSKLSAIENLQATARYCAKYVTKEISEQDKGKKRYWHSNGLKKPHIDENVDVKPYINNPNATTWDNELYTGYQIPHSNSQLHI